MGKHNFDDYTYIGSSQEKYSKFPDTIYWNNLTRNDPGHFLKHIDEPLSNFTAKFTMKVDEIKNISGKNRHLISLLKFWKESGTILSSYISEVQNSNTEYKIVFFQRKEGKNIRVFVSEKNLKVGTLYLIEVLKAKYLVGIKITEYPNTPIIDSGELIGYDEKYSDIILCQGHGFSNDPEDSISGDFSDLIIERTTEVVDTTETDEKEKAFTESKFDVFIAYYRISALDYAKTLWRGLDDSGLTPFRDEENIRKSDEWETTRDSAIINSKQFILLMTPGFEIRPQVKHEYKLAIENNIPVLYCKDSKLSEKHLCMQFEDRDPVFFTDYNLVSFSSMNELFREVYFELDEQGWFPVCPSKST